jgi:hypothetical protein
VAAGLVGLGVGVRGVDIWDFEEIVSFGATLGYKVHQNS